MNSIVKHGMEIVVVFNNDFDSYDEYEDECEQLQNEKGYSFITSVWVDTGNHFTILDKYHDTSENVKDIVAKEINKKHGN